MTTKAKILHDQIISEIQILLNEFLPSQAISSILVGYFQQKMKLHYQITWAISRTSNDYYDIKHNNVVISRVPITFGENGVIARLQCCKIALESIKTVEVTKTTTHKQPSVDYIPHSQIADISMGVKICQIIITIKNCDKYSTTNKIKTDSNGITGKFTKMI